MDVDSPHTRHGAAPDAATPGTPLPEAIARLRALLDDDPHDLDALGRLGDAQLADHDPDGALLTATIAIGLDPDWDLPHRQASIACSRRGRHREAIAHAEQAVRLAPGDPRGFTALARALMRAKQDLPRARQAAIRAIVLAPDAAEPHLVFGMVSRAEGEYAAAEAGFRRALQLDPGNASARNELARLALRRAARPLGGSAEGAIGVAAPAGPAAAVAEPRRGLDRAARTLLARLRADG
jgi:tetratricopeptide (TPR) repeat protein